MKKQNKGKGIVQQIKDAKHVTDDNILRDAFSPLNYDKQKAFKIITGEKGMDKFDTEMIILSVDHKELGNRYREARKELYDTKQKYKRLTSNKLIKLLIWLKIITTNK